MATGHASSIPFEKLLRLTWEAHDNESMRQLAYVPIGRIHWHGLQGGGEMHLRQVLFHGVYTDSCRRNSESRFRL